MRQSLTQQRPGGVELPDSVGSFNRRKRNSLYVTVTLLIVSVLILTVGLAATTRTQNVTVGGYYPGVILGFGSFLGIIGSNLIENKRQMLVASIVFISFGVIAAFCCAIVDGVFAARHIDLRPLYAGRCQYYSKSTTPPEVRSNLTPSLPTLNCTVENAHPSVSYYSRPQVTSYNTYYHSTPHLPPYSAYDFQHSSVFPASTPSGLSDEPPSMSPSPSYMWSSNAPPRYSPPYFPPFEKPPPYTP
ncbi:transmembrane protein 255A isoform X3 [Indicator indicator]|uniref:transmembrane protein 255A isoform X3 n=1 Tax=Indicator indicator TaxID=1002788 RepID=UPI0023DE7CB5|nr:transmembrane protein 255A isoform X3 [Indicator indicator]